MEHAGQDRDYQFPQVRIVSGGAPLRWLQRGWADIRRAPLASLFYGIAFSLMGMLLEWFVDRAAVELALVTGFLLVAPFLAIGLYDLSRAGEAGKRVMLADSLSAWQVNAGAVGLYALILALLMAVWIRVSVVVVALFFTGGLPAPGALLPELVASGDGLAFMAVYGAAGFGFALLVFATSVVSIPMLLDRKEMDALTAMIVSFNAVRLNFGPMLMWAAFIVALTAIGLATWHIGLVLTMPLIGHATWHAYREVVVPVA
jgi:uncharacterized membrane protein